MASAVASSLPAVTPSRHEAFMRFYEGEAEGNAARAAELAGYAFPKVEGPKLAKRYAGELARRAQARRAAAQPTETEALERLAAIIRNPEHREHLKAVELGLRVFGKLSDKAQVEEGKSNVLREIRGLLGDVAKLAGGTPRTSLPPVPIIDVQAQESPQLSEPAGEGGEGS